MDKKSVLSFLQEHPEFLAEHANILGVRMHDDKVRSFAQAQMAASQQKIKKMAKQVEVMLDDAQANHATMNKLFALNLKLLAANTVKQAADALYQSLAEDFGIRYMRLVLIAEPVNKARVPGGLKIMRDSKAGAAVAALEKVEAGGKIKPELRSLLNNDSNAVLESFLQLPLLIGGQTGGLLLLADEDVGRFSADLSTEWVSQLAQAVGVLLSRMMGYR
ncbi:DUF484 family protein [Neisseria arctica]|uniref:DUF484 family protein n=1 Tax=Neisseria arctica TaxID=1470200 RepID=UPI000649FAF4|nr:DUF484 family protein [Neisseria arctica]UOO86079.1 DUF484 family protein [Neisseria arctica]